MTKQSYEKNDVSRQAGADGNQIAKEMIEAGATALERQFWLRDPDARSIGKYIRQIIAKEIFQAKIVAAFRKPR